MIKCSKCGYDNPPMRLYCIQCKARLSLEKITRDLFFNTKKHFDYGHRLLLTVISVVTAGLALALWPDQIVLPQITPEELGLARGKLLKLQKGTATEPMVFSEKEVNILFNYLLQEGRRQSAARFAPAAVSAAAVTIKPSKIIVRLNYQSDSLSGIIPVGPLVITYTFTGVPKRGPDGLRFVPLSGNLGHLPLPGLGPGLALKRLSRLFQPFKNARAFLNSLEVIEMKNGSMAVAVARETR